MTLRPRRIIAREAEIQPPEAAVEVVCRPDSQGLSREEAVVFKPAGLSAERRAGDRGDSLARRVERQFGWATCWLPHRLDRPTRGLMVVAGSREAAARCGEDLRAGRWTKWYFARIPRPGDAQALVGPHRAYLKRAGRLATCVRSGGDPSRLEIIAACPSIDDAETSHVLIRLDTGRFHQIRVMLSALGSPLIGDVDYGGAPPPERFDLEAVALRICRGDSAYTHRLERHQARKGVAPELERALDAVLSEG